MQKIKEQVIQPIQRLPDDADYTDVRGQKLALLFRQ